MESTDSSGGPPPQPNLPPGFRFHPTDEELVIHYLKRKADSSPLPVAIIADVDLYKFDPWELPAKALFGEQEWYFFSPRDRKYPNGARPNRAATSGYWKATGTDKPVISTGGGNKKIGVKKALVFYSGKPPKGVKSDWIMHEYRLTDNKPSLRCDFGNKKNSLRPEQLLSSSSSPTMMMMMAANPKRNIPMPFWEEGNQDPAKRFNGGIGDCSNVVSSMAAPPLMQQQSGIFGEGLIRTSYQSPGLNWYS
ncbi:unnamed protein product [Thlaspi arvense]|uniref:NAC domain-containing protein n=1 Tax=Thlaspi arvense TaxID=13288 RepID=A0AAU9R9L8_THLAR|nr:unnamed protein product [Thlaspi arvense]